MKKLKHPIGAVIQAPVHMPPPKILQCRSHDLYRGMQKAVADSSRTRALARMECPLVRQTGGAR
jgi:hypothetical protein